MVIDNCAMEKEATDCFKKDETKRAHQHQNQFLTEMENSGMIIASAPPTAAMLASV